jgi:hypothetical protein
LNLFFLAAGVAVNVGSVHNPEKVLGLAHFLEHMVGDFVASILYLFEWPIVYSCFWEQKSIPMKILITSIWQNMEVKWFCMSKVFCFGDTRKIDKQKKVIRTLTRHQRQPFITLM